MSDISKNIRQFRKLNEMSQEELAKLLKLSRETITRYENGTREPNIGMIKKIAKALNTNISNLISIEGNEKTKEILMQQLEYLAEENKILKDKNQPGLIASNVLTMCEIVKTIAMTCVTDF